MKKYYLILIGLLIGLSQQVYADEKREIPKEHKWENTDDRKNNFPLLFQDDSYFFSGMTDILSEYFHYNMGTGSNAWFYQDTPVYNGDNYTSNRKIHIVTPN